MSDRWDRALVRRMAALACKGVREPVAVEIGCMYYANGLESTRQLLAALPGVRFASIDRDPEHIARCKALLGPDAARVEFREGDSLKVLPEALRAKPLDFALLDGSGDPARILAEFMVCRAHLKPAGIVLMDDANEMPPTEGYAGPRPHGKASLVLPWLEKLCEPSRTWRLFGAPDTGKRRMLAYGPASILAPDTEGSDAGH